MNSKHDRHDRVLVARYAAGDAYPSEIDQAQRLVDGCAECAALAGDIRLIAARTADLPPVRRNRDFRISPEQAHDLSGSWLERVMRGLSSPGWTVVRPLAGAALAVGIVLAGIGALPTSFGSPGSVALGPAIGSASQLAPTRADAVNAPPTQTTDTHFEAGSPPQNDNATDGGAPASAAASSAGGLVSNPLGSSVTPQAAATEGTPVTTVPAPASTPPPPPKANETPKAVPPTSIAVAVIPSAAPSVAPAQAPPQADKNGTAFASSDSQSALDRSALLVLGLGLALASALALAVVWIARRRYADPLVR